MTLDELDGWLERARTDSASMVAPDGFTDRVMRDVRRYAPPLPGRFEELSSTLVSTVASGALVLAGVMIWMSLGDGPIGLSSLPVAVTAVALTMGGLAWTWFDDPRGADFRIRLSDLRPY